MSPTSHGAKFVKDEWRKFACDHEWLLDPGRVKFVVTICFFNNIYKQFIADVQA